MEETPQPPKRRGRPPKSAETPTPAPAAESAAPAPAKKAPRKRMKLDLPGSSRDMIEPPQVPAFEDSELSGMFQMQGEDPNAGAGSIQEELEAMGLSSASPQPQQYSATPPDPQGPKQSLRSYLGAFYLYQKSRIRLGNQLVRSVKQALGIPVGVKEEEAQDAPEENVKMLEAIRTEYSRISDVLIGTWPAVPGDFIWPTQLPSDIHFDMARNYFLALRQEQDMEKFVGEKLKQFSIWNNYLSKIVGIGPLMGAVFICFIDITKARNPSSLVRLFGIDVAEDGYGRSARVEHRREVVYTTSKGAEATMKILTYAKIRKAKLLLAVQNLIRGRNEKYYTIFQNYQHRKHTSTDPYWQTATNPHKLRAALRYTAKWFLYALYEAMCLDAGIEPKPTYSEAKLGQTHDHSRDGSPFKALPRLTKEEKEARTAAAAERNKRSQDVRKQLLLEREQMEKDGKTLPVIRPQLPPRFAGAAVAAAQPAA